MSDDEVPPIGGEGEYGEDDFSDDDGDYQPPSEFPDGMTKEIVTQAPSDNWKKPKAGDEVKIHYVGTLESDGSEFVSSRGSADAFSFHLGKSEVIKGLDLGVATMKKGEVSKFTIASEFLAGDVPEKIPKDKTCVFEVELLNWITKEDIFSDGGVVKSLVEEGSGWKNPKVGDEVLLDLKCEALGENKSSFEYIVGSEGFGDLSKVIDKALTGMKKGELASLCVSKEYANRSEGTTVTIKLKEVYDTKDVSFGKDTTVMKKQIQEGEGYETPKDGSTVKLVVESATDGSAALPGFKKATLSFTAGNGEVCDALEAAVINMKKGEKAVLTVTDMASIQEKGLGLAAVKADKAVLTVELPEFEKAEKDTWNMSEDEKVTFGGQRKEVGTTLFKAGRFRMAVQRYKQVVDLFSSIDNYGEENKEKAKTLKKSCDLNLSACYLKFDDFTETKATCAKILKDERTNVKALYRRAQAEYGLKNFTECMKDCKEVVMLDSQNRDARELSKKAHAAQKQVDKEAKGMFANMCKALGKGPIPEPGKSEPKHDDMDDDDYEEEPAEDKKEGEADATGQ